MSKTFVLCLCGLSFAAIALGQNLLVSPVVLQDEDTPSREVVQLDTFEALDTEYKLALTNHFTAIKATKDAATKRKLRGSHPAFEFLPRFEALGEAGDARGWIWIARNQRKLGVKKDQRIVNKTALYDRVVQSNSEATWYVDSLNAISGDLKFPGEGKIKAFKKIPTSWAKQIPNQAIATYFTGAAYLECESPEDQQVGRKMLKRLIAEHPTQGISMRARLLVENRKIEAGEMAPDFTGTTIEGAPLRLSDYRGKVVLIDFFGFW